jgi:hypothetical protein
MGVMIKPIDERGAGPDTYPDRVKLVTAELTTPAGSYTKSGYPVTAQQFGLHQLRDVRADATDRYWFAFELAPGGAELSTLLPLSDYPRPRDAAECSKGSRGKDPQMRKALLFIAIAALGLAVPAVSQAQVFTNERIPIDLGAYFVPCANGGAGEYVPLSGTFHVLYADTTDASGGHHVVSDGTWTASGVGQTTGSTYKGPSETIGEANFTAGQEVTQLITLRIVGKQATFYAYSTAHFTFAPDGTLTADVSNSRAECK